MSPTTSSHFNVYSMMTDYNRLNPDKLDHVCLRSHVLGIHKVGTFVVIELRSNDSYFKLCIVLFNKIKTAFKY